MCKYFSDIFYSLCTHTVAAAAVPRECGAILAECPTRTAARQAAWMNLMSSSSDNLNRWHSRLHPSNSTTTYVPSCYMAEFVPETTWTVPANPDDPFHTACRSCRTRKYQRDIRWTTMMDALVATSKYVTAGGRSGFGDVVLAMGMPMQEVREGPTDMRLTLRGDVALFRTKLTQVRNQAFATKNTNTVHVFRSGLWPELVAYEHLILAKFMMRAKLPCWSDYDIQWDLDVALITNLQKVLQHVLTEGQWLLDHAGQQAETMPLLPVLQPQDADSDEEDTLFPMDL